MLVKDYKWQTIDRNKMIGGSDMASILGYSKWAGPHDTMQQKLMGESIEVNDAMFWGTHLEPAVANVYQKLFLDDGLELFDPAATMGASVVHKEHKWLSGSPDRLIINSDNEILEGLEIKCIGFFSKKAWKEGVPLYYKTQAQVYMMLFNLPKWTFFVLCGGQSHFMIELEESPFMQEAIIEHGSAFHKALEHGRSGDETDLAKAMAHYYAAVGGGQNESEGINAIPMG